MKQLEISNIERTTKECSIITLAVPKSLQSEYNFIQGQYLAVEANINGENVRRSYSICSAPADNEWKIGVKKIEGGKFSTYANDVLKAGDKLSVAPPQGKFFIKVDAKSDRSFAFFAAGSGITPILSLIKTYLLEEPNCTIKLFYANRTVSTIILKEELEALKNQYMGKFEIFYFLTRQSRSMPLFDGRIDLPKLASLVNTKLLNISDHCHYFSCGPQEMVFAVNDFLKSNNIPETNIHFELFNTSGPDKKTLDRVKNNQSGKMCHVTIIEGGKTMQFDLERGSDNVLDAALANNADLPYACKGGVCSTCRAKVIDGNVEMLLSYGLEQDEIDDNYVLTCQTFPMSDRVTIDFDV